MIALFQSKSECGQKRHTRSQLQVQLQEELDQRPTWHAPIATQPNRLPRGPPPFDRAGQPLPLPAESRFEGGLARGFHLPAQLLARFVNGGGLVNRHCHRNHCCVSRRTSSSVVRPRCALFKPLSNIVRKPRSRASCSIRGISTPFTIAG